MKNGQTTPLAAVEKISMNLIDPFPNHPYHVIDDYEMIELIESIRKNGLIIPIIVRRKGNRYELISGHRRKRAYEYLGYAEIACSVINASDDEAVIMMVDSNCQRTKLLPSERAFAYKMKLDAMKRQGKRTDLTSAQLAQKSVNKTSRQILAEQEGQSKDQIRRYIRLTNLVSELLEFVDLEKIKLCPAVELSYLDEEAQRDVVDQIDETDSLYRLPSCEIALAAPTGMAAKRMMASTDKEARTIHKLIEYNPALPLLTLNEDNPLTYDFVIVDELSMVDIDTMAMLLRAVRDDTQLLFLGDVHQLPSIGPGEVLHDIINSNVFPVTALKRSFRHGSRKTILENANRVLEGITELDFGHSDCLFYDVPDSSGDKNCRRLMKMLLKVYYEEYAACGRKAEKIQVLSPMRVKTLVSVDQINPELQDLVNALIDEEDEVRIGPHRFRKNDRVTSSFITIQIDCIPVSVIMFLIIFSLFYLSIFLDKFQ